MVYNANYPASLDSLTNPTTTTNRNDVGFELHGVIGRLQDIVEAIESKVGIGVGGPPASAAVLRRTATGNSGWGTVATGDVAAGAISQLVPFTFAANPSGSASSSLVGMAGAFSAITPAASGTVVALVGIAGLANSASAFVNLGLFVDAVNWANWVFDDRTVGVRVSSSAVIVITGLSVGASHAIGLAWSSASGTLTHAGGYVHLLELKR